MKSWRHNLPYAKYSNRLLTKEKSLLILNLELIVLPLTVNTVILKHVCLQQASYTIPINLTPQIITVNLHMTMYVCNNHHIQSPST